VRSAARTHGLPEALLQAVIEVESGFDAGAVSPKGALGLMQLMPDTARTLRVRDARDPADNIDGGARYLKELLARHGNDLTLALAAYNAGPGAVQRSGGIPRIAETQAHVPRVIARYHRCRAAAIEERWEFRIPSPILGNFTAGSPTAHPTRGLLLPAQVGFRRLAAATGHPNSELVAPSFVVQTLP
jgi:hypothetical protein